MAVWRRACRHLTRRAAVEALLHNRVLNSNINIRFFMPFDSRQKNLG
jgi:hypothetical protein